MTSARVMGKYLSTPARLRAAGLACDNGFLGQARQTRADRQSVSWYIFEFLKLFTVKKFLSTKRCSESHSTTKTSSESRDIIRQRLGLSDPSQSVTKSNPLGYLLPRSQINSYGNPFSFSRVDWKPGPLSSRMTIVRRKSSRSALFDRFLVSFFLVDDLPHTNCMPPSSLC